MSGLDLGLVGNCAIAALVDRTARVVWMCLPRFDGDPVFHALLGTGPGEEHDGTLTVELPGLEASSQSYDENTAVLRTRLRGAGGEVEVVDLVPRFEARGRMFRPQTFVRQIRPVSGSPRIRIRVRPRFGWSAQAPEITRGSNHVRYVGPDQAIRLSTDVPVDYVLSEQAFIDISHLLRPAHLQV